MGRDGFEESEEGEGEEGHDREDEDGESPDVEVTAPLFVEDVGEREGESGEGSPGDA